MKGLLGIETSGSRAWEGGGLQAQIQHRTTVILLSDPHTNESTCACGRDGVDLQATLLTRQGGSGANVAYLNTWSPLESPGISSDYKGMIRAPTRVLWGCSRNYHIPM